MRRKARSKKDQQLDFLEEALQNNYIAVHEGGRKKSWSLHDIADIKPMTSAQELMIRSYITGNNIVANGYPGTGKTLIALYLALTDILAKDSHRNCIRIVRSTVAVRDMGFLPGTVEEKLAPFETPYSDLLGFLVNKNRTYENMKEAGYIEFVPTTHIRGLTWDNSVVIIDEMQNFTIQEINSTITRIGTNSRVIVIGDQLQNDLYRNKFDSSGFGTFLDIACKMKSFDVIDFQKEDIVRSEFVKEWLIALEDGS